MRRDWRLPMIPVVVAVVCLIALLAGLQYRWLGRISDAERERLKGTLNTRASEFAQDMDRELTRAFLLFQLDPLQPDAGLAAQIAARYDRWYGTARFPRMLQDVYVVPPGPEPGLEHFDAASHTVMAAAWPRALASLKQQVAANRSSGGMAPGPLVIRAIVPPVLEDVPAVVVTSPVLLAHAGPPDLKQLPSAVVYYVVLVLDRDYITRELLPALAQQHFRGTGDGFDYQLAVVRNGGGVVYHSDAGFAPPASGGGDASIDLFQVRTQDFANLASEVRRFTAFTSTNRAAIVRETVTMHPGRGGEKPPFSIIVSGGPSGPNEKALATGFATATAARTLAGTTPQWRLVVKHPSGSLEHAVNTVRRRNLAISTGILGVLGLSLTFLVISTRRAQDLARQQLEFVATVSHELRTPLAVIRSAADNLAEGVIHDDSRIRQYGELVRQEGRRLSELVEQILEFAGLQSGQRTLSMRPIAIDALLRDVAASAELVAQQAGIAIEVSLPDGLPSVAGDESALRRVFQNLIGNAIKYGADGRWIGIAATGSSDGVDVTVTDRGIGIAAADQPRIFDPFYRTQDVVAAQIQGAGLGLSLVRRIVEAHGGRVTVKSAPGAGSTFTVSLPATRGEPADRPERMHATAPQHS